MADTNRYQPPANADPQLVRISDVLDAVVPQPRYGVMRDARVTLSPSDGLRRLAPPSTGQTALLPAADASNVGKAVRLFVANGQGALTLRPVSGTVDGASSVAFGAGTYAVTVWSGGDGRWATETPATAEIVTAKLADDGVTNAKLANMAAATVKGRALGAGSGDPTDLTAAQVADIIETEAFDWSGAHQFTGRVRWNGPFSQTLTGNTDNLAIGAVNVVRLVGAGFNLTGMVADVSQQLVWLQNADSASNLVLVHNATSTAANRFFCPNNANYTMPPRSAVWARYDAGDSRWYIAPGAA